MKRGFLILFVALLLVARISVCLYFDDGKVQFDEKSYLNMIVNFVDQGSISYAKSQIVGLSPKDYLLPSGPKQYISLIRESNRPHDSFADYQWFGALFYLPVVFIGSTKVVVLINNLLYFLSGLIILKLSNTSLSRFQQTSFWAFYLFLPMSFTQLSGGIGSDMPFLTLLLIAWYAFVHRGTLNGLSALAALCLTRPLGLIFVGTLVIWNLIRKDYRRVLIASSALLSAVLINHVVGNISLDKNSKNQQINTSPALVFYCANSTNGDGNTDYLMRPEIASRDNNLVKYFEGKISGLELIEEVIVQNLHTPMIFLKNNYFKTMNYFFNYWPKSWSLRGGEQSVSKKIIQFSFSLFIIALIFYSIARFKSRDQYLYVIFFVISYMYHMLFLCRYRYFIPVLYLGFPSILFLFQSMIHKISSHCQTLTSIRS